MFKQFCQKMEMSNDIVTNHGTEYECGELKIESFKSKDIQLQYSSLWNDFISLRVNLIDGKLKYFLQNRLNVSSKTIKQFYQYFQIQLYRLQLYQQQILLMLHPILHLTHLL